MKFFINITKTAICLSIFFTSQANADYFTITRLGSFPTATDTRALAINDAGQAVGYALVQGSGLEKGLIWQDAGTFLLPPAYANGTNIRSKGYAISNVGTAAGMSTTISGVIYGQYWSGDAFQGLQKPNGPGSGDTSTSEVLAMNDKGLLVGYSTTRDLPYPRPCASS
jgi:uncharacterized membrane protein